MLRNNVLKEYGLVMVNRDDELLKYLKMIGRIVAVDDYSIKPYLNTTQNGEYIRSLISEKVNNAYVILGGGDSVFQLLMNDILDITAIDVNELQNAIFALKKACIRTLNMYQYESYLLDKDSIHFLSEDIFRYVKDGFLEEEQTEKRLWETIFGNTPLEEIKTYFFKGGLECCPIDITRMALPFVKKKGLYNKIKTNLENAKIDVKIGDAVANLVGNNKKYDLIDITNILLFQYQLLSKEEYKEYLLKIRKIYEENLNENGTFILDYMFGLNIKQLLNGGNFEGLQSQQLQIYQQIHKELIDTFKLEKREIVGTVGATVLKGDTDIVVYTKK